jgi:hypothetical protein
MYSRLIIVVIFLVTILSVVGCQAPFVGESPLSASVHNVSMLPTPAPFVFPDNLDEIEVESGKAVVIGRLLSEETLLPIANTPVRLAAVYYAEEGNKDPNQGAWTLDNAFSPFAYSNEDGLFIFEDVEAREYVVFVGDIMAHWAVEVNEEGLPYPRTIPADELTNLGDIVIEY